MSDNKPALEILVYSIKENAFVMDTVVAIANLLAAGGVSVAVKEENKKTGFDYKKVRGSDSRGVFKLNNVTYYPESVPLGDPVDVLIWDAGVVNVLYEMKSGVTGYLCVDANEEQPEDVAGFFDDIETKTNVLLFNGGKTDLHRFNMHGVKCISIPPIKAGICPYDLKERVKNELILKGLSLADIGDIKFSQIKLKTADDRMPGAAAKKKKGGLFSKHKPVEKPVCDGESGDEDEDYSWTSDIYAKQLDTETTGNEEKDPTIDITLSDGRNPADEQDEGTDAITATHKAFMPDDIPAPEPPAYEDETKVFKKNIFENIPRPETPPMYDDQKAILVPPAKAKPLTDEKPESREDIGDATGKASTEDLGTDHAKLQESREIPAVNRNNEIQKGYDAEDDEADAYDEDDDEDYEYDEDEYDEEPDLRERGADALRGIVGFLGNKIEGNARNKERSDIHVQKMKFMGRMSIYVLDLYNGCGASYISGSLASVMAQTYGKNTYIIRRQKAATPDNKKIKEVTEKEDFRKIERNAVVIYDGGISNRTDEKTLQMARKCDARVLVCSGTEEGISILAQHVHQFGEEAVEWIYVFNNVTSKKQQKNISELMQKYDIIFTPPHDFCNPPKAIIAQWQRCFRKLLSDM